MRGNMGYALILFLSFVFCGCVGIKDGVRVFGTESNQETSEPIERFEVTKNPDSVDVDYYFNKVLQLRYSQYLPDSGFYGHYKARLWLTCAPFYNASMRPVTFYVDQRGNLSVVIIIAVSESGRVHRVFYHCSRYENQRLCTQAQEDFDQIFEQLEIERRLRKVLPLGESSLSR